jgi:hypothetical protein
METPESLATGIVASDDHRLILRPFPPVMRRRELVRIAGFIGIAMAVIAGVALALFRPHLGFVPMIAAAVFSAAAITYRVSTKVTFIARRDADGIYVESRNRILRTTRRRLLHRYADIAAVELRPRVNPNALHPGASPMGAYAHYDVLLRKGRRSVLLWYTRHPQCAEHIAGRIASFAGVPVNGTI